MIHAPHEPRILPLALENVTFEAGGMRLIKDLNCQFEAGKRSIIIGPNGAGKSLLLRLCHGLIPPASGSVHWRGPGSERGTMFIRHRQAMVFQRPVMLRRSVAGNVEYALSLRGVDRGNRNDIVDQVLQRTGLRRLWDNPARVLSGGEQQRLALARAWALSPEVLFLDEPTANLDPSATHSVEEIINAIHQTGTLIVMTTHDLGQAHRMADDVMFLHRGRLLEHAPANRFFDHPKNDLAQAFLGGELLWWKKGRDNRKQSKQKTEDYER